MNPPAQPLPSSHQKSDATIRAIGVCTGGGDCPGLNAVIRSVYHAAQHRYGWRVIGIEDGFDGLIWTEKSHVMTAAEVRGILPRGGTILGTTNRGNPFAYEREENGVKVRRDFSQQLIHNMNALGIDALIVIGGDGTMKIARDLFARGVPVVGVPKTIDNDLSATDVTFGFDTALHTATDAIDKIHTTAESHHRVMLVEVMGRDAGWIALDAGIAGGADIILIPEIPFSVEKVCERIEELEKGGKGFSVIVVAEGIMPSASDGARRPGTAANAVGDLIAMKTKKEVRVTALGHIQRGGSPSPFDRVLASRYGVAAVNLVARGDFGKMVALRGTQIISVDLREATGKTKLVDPGGEKVSMARSLGISFGDK
ncbi:MAG TPA: ATP-dependent 6-phosphofructokinase [Candidatus Acidoferrales bacterium]